MKVMGDAYDREFGSVESWKDQNLATSDLFCCALRRKRG